MIVGAFDVVVVDLAVVAGVAVVMASGLVQAVPAGLAAPADPADRPSGSDQRHRVGSAVPCPAYSAHSSAPAARDFVRAVVAAAESLAAAGLDVVAVEHAERAVAAVAAEPVERAERAAAAAAAVAVVLAAERVGRVGRVGPAGPVGLVVPVVPAVAEEHTAEQQRPEGAGPTVELVVTLL